jgi:hypothetical protein
MQKKINIPWPVLACSLFVFIFTNLFSYFIFDHIPHVHDEIDYLFQAKIFKSGRVYVPSPCAKEFFDFAHMINNGKWYSQYTPGYPFLLLLGLLIQAPWLVNPLLAALSIILFYFLGKVIFNSNAGILASVLGTISIWFLLMSSTMMPHTSCLFFISLFLLFLFRSIKNPSITNGLFAGLGLGMAFLIRPYNVVLISIPFLIYYAVILSKDMRKRLKNAVAFGLIIIISLSILMIYNQITNGHPLRMGYIVCHGPEHGIGLGRTGYTDIPHTPFLGAFKFGESLESINNYLFGWPLSSFLAILPLLFIVRITPDYRKKDLLLATGFISLSVGLYFYWGTHDFIGARMYFETIPILLLLSSHGIIELHRVLSLKLKKFKSLSAKKILAVILVVFTAYAFFIRFPNWIWPPDNKWNYVTFANNFCRVTPNINKTLKSQSLGQSVVIIKFLYYPFRFEPKHWWWGSGFLYNGPQLNEKIIYAHNRDEENIDLFQCFPERKFYFYLGTLEKGMLIPLKKEANKILYGAPISSPKKGKKYIELINKPQKFYNIYSPDFKHFLDEIYERNNYFDIDVANLIEMGNLYKNKRNFKKAAFCFEAALQIEKHPDTRILVLNNLVVCYIKTGRTSEAKKIMKNIKINDPKHQKLYDLIPEKGF